MRIGKNRIARDLAIFLTAVTMSSSALAEGLALPRDRADPITLPLPDAALATIGPSELLQVFVGFADPCCEGRTPIAGRYTTEANTIAFIPAFGFDLGQRYVARVRTTQKDMLIPFNIRSNAEPTPAAVTEFFPTGDTLPENVLRLYVHFSVPMQPHVAFDYIKLRDSSGTADEAAFMRFKQELWNEDRTRLTVLIDPGRIKRNVATNLELGPALLAGQEYTLSVDAGWPSADGRSRLSAFTKQFIVTAPLRDLPNVGRWETTPPCLGTNDPLRIAFDRPFDRHLLGQTMRVISADGEVIKGTVEIADGERKWAFFPDEEWQTDGARVLVSVELEDVAANNFRDLLDHVGSDKAIGVSTVAVPVSLKMCSG